MVSVALDSVVIAPLANLAATVALDVAELSESDNSLGDVRVYAGGRVRSISRAGRKRTFAAKFDVVTDRALLETLRSLKGQIVLLRDPYGRKSYCVFYSLAVSERIPIDVVTVSVGFQEITHSEVV